MITRFFGFAHMPRGWISRLKKIPRLSSLRMTYSSRHSRRWYSQKKKIPTKSIFSRIYKVHFNIFIKKKMLKFVNSKKNTSGWIFFFFEYHRLECRDK